MRRGKVKGANVVGWKISKVRREERLASYVGFFSDVVIACYTGRLFAMLLTGRWRASDGKCQESYAENRNDT